MTTSTTKSFKRFGYLLATFFFAILTYITLTGELQKIIHFTGTLNEIGFFVLASTLTVICAFITVAE